MSTAEHKKDKEEEQPFGDLNFDFLDDEVEESRIAADERKRERERRVKTGEDSRIVGASDAPDDAGTQEKVELTIEEHEAKWGFTLDELQAATKVVSVLFTNPSLYVGDKHLAESRLYTMISRDRKTKRENRDTYKVVMRQERILKDRQKREQDIETIRKTTMKREREDALNALLIKPKDDDAAPATPLLIKHHDPTDPTATSSPAGSPIAANAGEFDESIVLTPEELHVMQIRGGFESIKALELWMYADRKEIIASAVTAFDEYNKKGHGVNDACVKEDLETSPFLPLCYFYAVFLRFFPHAFGTQMPPVPPLLVNPGIALLLLRKYLVEELQHVVGQLHRDLVSLHDVEEEVAKNGDKCSTTTTIAELTSLLQCRETFASPVQCMGALFACVAFRDAVDLSKTSPEALLAVNSVDLILKTLVALADDTQQDDEKNVAAAAAELSHVIPFKNASKLSKTALLAIGTAVVDVAIAGRAYAFRATPQVATSVVLVDPLIVPAHPPCDGSGRRFETSFVALLAMKYAKGVDFPDQHLSMNRTQKCHTCKGKFDVLHPYYYSLCRACGEYNFNKRLMTRDLRGKTVLLTGCRIKIGYAMCISLLRCGATVIGTTRFAHDGMARFSQESDFEDWKDRLHLFSLDMRDMWMVTQFCAFISGKFKKLFAIVNNAAQTIARTPQYTQKLREYERAPDPQHRQQLLTDANSSEWYNFFLQNSSVTIGHALQLEHHPEEHARPFVHPEDDTGDNDQDAADAATSGAGDAQHSASAAQQSGTVATPGAGVSGTGVVYDRYDTHAEESDKRDDNSWTMNMAEVHGSEAAETMTINALSPFILNSKLKPMLLNRDGDTDPRESRFIVNVSAMEGCFYRFKLTTHPHTNMAKAALNMMTRTSAEDYARDCIWMNSVDTGWITDESPLKKRSKRLEEMKLCPLDEVDAAARCLDLIYTDSHEYGKFWKDFHTISW